MRFKTSVCVCAVVMLIGPATLGAATGDSRLADAMRRHDRDAVRVLLKQGAAVDGPQADGATALHWAVQQNDLEIVDALLRAGAKVNAATDLGATPLSLACTNGNATMVDRLITGGANVNAAVTSGETPLMTCARTGTTEAVAQLISRGAQVNAKEPWQQQTALMWAVSQGHTAIVRMLIDHGADTKGTSKEGYTSLHFAARQGVLEAAKMLLTAGAGVNEKAKDGSTPLLVATVRGYVPVALFLLEKGADPNIADTGFTPLHWASGTFETRLTGGPFGYTDPMSGIVDRSEKIALIKSLLAHGANPNAQAAKNLPRFGSTSFRQPQAGATPFFLASYSTEVEVMRILVAAGADPNLPTKNKTTPLMAAAGLNRAQGESPVTEKDALVAVNYILELGGNPAALNDIGENALHGVAYLGWKSLFQLLVEKGAPINAVSKQGLTPYIIATGHGDRAISTTVVYHKDLAEMCLKMGADPKLGVPIE